MKKLSGNQGFSLVEALIALAITTVFVLMALNYGTTLNKNTNLARYISTKDRIFLGFRNLAILPATLRSSMRVGVGGVPVNPKLLACAGGNPLNSCEHGVEYPFTMYGPLIQRDAGGNIIGVQAVSSPLGSTTPLRLDSFGSPCTVAGPDCALLVFTSFKAQCPPTAVAAPSTSTSLVAKPNCSVADVIEVTFYIQLDPAVGSSDSALASFITPVIGSVLVSGEAISGNHPQ